MTVTSAPLPGSQIEFSESPSHFLVIATEVAKALNWEISQVRNNGFLAYTSGSSYMPGEQVRVQISGNTAEVSSEFSEGHIADEQTVAYNIHNFIQGIHAVKYYFSAEELELKYFQLQSLPGFDPSASPRPTITEAKPPASLGSVKDYPVTAAMVAANLILFAIMVANGADVLQPATTMMINWGANFGLRTLDGEWWRLLTSCFLHFGVVHLLMNMYALIYVGLILEPQLGSLRVAVAYLLTGIVASLTSLWWHSWVVAAGASGAVFGLYGVLLALLTTNYMEQKIRKPMLLSIGFFVFYNLANGLNDGIDNAAHIGGLISGMAIGYTYIYTLKKPQGQRLLRPILVILTVIIVSLSAATYSKIPNALAIYNQQVSVFAQNQAKAENAHQGIEQKTLTQKLRTIEDTSTVLWKENAAILQSLDRLNLPEELEKKVQLLSMYTELRLQGLDLEYRGLKANSQQYKEPLESISRQMEQIKISLQQ